MDLSLHFVLFEIKLINLKNCDEYKARGELCPVILFFTLRPYSIELSSLIYGFVLYCAFFQYRSFSFYGLSKGVYRRASGFCVCRYSFLPGLSRMKTISALGQIDNRTLFENRDIGRIEEKLMQQKRAVLKKRRELERIERKIDHRLQWLMDAQNTPLDTASLVRRPACRIVWMDDPLKIDGFLDMEAPIRRLDQSDAEAVVFLGKVGPGISREHLQRAETARYDGVFLILDRRLFTTRNRLNCRKRSARGCVFGEVMRRLRSRIRSCSNISVSTICRSPAFPARLRSSTMA